ncbi:hypothetical protein jhhlp_004094 [Lomentospora prolificans]|uniref:Wbp11/ELF5/Saf1 N-terminal domain-containing protein n=1 Tax=Lomentospora prolificans TaxID=41688 RepID=A0A2N3NAL4_9PEZI|nr:hypothetical protein jhhlp_004094 [Lomentospora prolificans]
MKCSTIDVKQYTCRGVGVSSGSKYLITQRDGIIAKRAIINLEDDRPTIFDNLRTASILCVCLNMNKERGYNPVQAQRKADKAKAIKKGRAEVQARRNEKLAKRNPHRLQKQIDDLKAITDNGGKLTRHEEQVLEGLEKELRAVNKAREALGDAAPVFRTPREGGQAVLGKRRRDGNYSSGDEDIPEDVKRIPMPRDTPPPIPKEIMDRWWAKRRARREAERTEAREAEALTRKEDNTRKVAPPETKTVYEAKPVVRDLRKEAVKAFVPTSVMMKMSKGKGQGGLMEPEEADRLEQEGYLKITAPSGVSTTKSTTGPQKASVEEVEDEDQ